MRITSFIVDRTNVHDCRLYMALVMRVIGQGVLNTPWLEMRSFISLNIMKDRIHNSDLYLRTLTTLTKRNKPTVPRLNRRRLERERVALLRIHQ